MDDRESICNEDTMHHDVQGDFRSHAGCCECVVAQVLTGHTFQEWADKSFRGGSNRSGSAYKGPSKDIAM